MQKIVVTGGARLEGEVRISGAKNAVLPILCATLLADAPVRITNVPRLHDVFTTAKLLAGLGAGIVHEGDAMTVDPRSPPIELTMTMLPSPRSFISGATIVMSQWLETMLLSRILRNCSSAIPSCGP